MNARHGEGDSSRVPISISTNHIDEFIVELHRLFDQLMVAFRREVPPTPYVAPSRSPGEKGAAAESMPPLPTVEEVSAELLELLEAFERCGHGGVKVFIREEPTEARPLFKERWLSHLRDSLSRAPELPAFAVRALRRHLWVASEQLGVRLEELRPFLKGATTWEELFIQLSACESAE